MNKAAMNILLPVFGWMFISLIRVFTGGIAGS